MACCKIHPYHLQKTGVCSFCLRERLTDLSSWPPFTVADSPPHRSHRRIASDVIGNSRSDSRRGLRKSGSVALLSSGGDGCGIAAGKKGGGFWSKILRSSSTVKRANNEVLKPWRIVK